MPLRRHLLALCLTALPLATWAAWPERPITIVVPAAAGGTTDIAARVLAEKMAKDLGTSIVVENKGGGGGSIGTAQVARAKPDGYTLLMGAVHHTIATSVYRKLGYDFEKDFAPITTVALVPNVLVVNPQVPAKTVQELLAQAKAQPGKLTYGSNGTGTGQHLIGAQFEGMGGVQLLHVPYKGSAPAITDTIGGQVPVMYSDLIAALPHIQAGKLRAIAVGSPQRVGVVPDVKTIAEQGFKGYEAVSWGGLVAPSGTPKAVVDRVAHEVRQILAEKEVQDRLLGAGAIAHFMAPTPPRWASACSRTTPAGAR